MAATREAGFGDEVKRRIILGTFALSSGYYDAYYGQAQKVRTLIARDFAQAFDEVDVLASPTAPTTAFKIGEKLDDPIAMYLNDIATIPANLAGVPGISLPSGLAPEDGLPTGIQFLAPATEDARLYNVGAALEAMLEDEWGGPLLAQGPGAGGVAMTTTSPDHRADAVRRGDGTLRPGARARGARRAQHRVEDVLRLPDDVRRARRTPRPARCAWRCPGALPVVNEKAVESAIRIGLALNCEIASWCRFARKNYFYPDMPKNFQTSQYDEPIAFNGWTEHRGATARSSGSRSSARTWRRTPASRCMSAARPDGSMAPTTRCSTSTGPASR